jgi:hypothetical protein
MGFINEAKYRLTKSETPPFWKKVGKIGALITGSALLFAAVPGGLVIGGIAAAFGIGISAASIFGAKDGSELVKVKVELEEVRKAAAKETEKAENEVIKNTEIK